MAKNPKPEAVVACWPQRNGIEYFGDTDYNDASSSALSFGVSLRGIVSDSAWSNRPSEAISDLSLRVFIDRAYSTMSIDIKMRGYVLLSTSEVELRAKTMKALTAKAEKAGYVLDRTARTRDVFSELLTVVDALGIKRAIEYRQGVSKNEMIPVAIAVRKIADYIDSRIARAGGWIEREAAA